MTASHNTSDSRCVRSGKQVLSMVAASPTAKVDESSPAYELFGKLVATHVGGEDQDGANGSVRCAEHNRAQPHPDRTVLFVQMQALRRGYAITITRGDDHRAIHAAQALALGVACRQHIVAIPAQDIGRGEAEQLLSARAPGEELAV